MIMLDIATKERKEFIKSVKVDSDTQGFKSGWSAEDLGERHVLHPAYKREDNPAHAYKFGSYILDQFVHERKVNAQH